MNRTDSTVTMRLSADSASYIDFKYALHPNTYLVDFSIDAKGMADKLAASNNYVDIEWAQRARQIEKGYVYENRLSELTYKMLGNGTDYLSANKDDEKKCPNVWTGLLSKINSSPRYSLQTLTLRKRS